MASCILLMRLNHRSKFKLTAQKTTHTHTHTLYLVRFVSPQSTCWRFCRTLDDLEAERSQPVTTMYKVGISGVHLNSGFMCVKGNEDFFVYEPKVSRMSVIRTNLLG